MRHLVPLLAALAGPFGCFVAADSEGTAPPTSTPPTTSTPPHYDPPAGCKRTACDADLEQCRMDARASCIKCQVDCGAIQIEYQSQCIAACGRLCSATDTTASQCDDSAKMCRASSQRNAFCADGIATACVPSRSSASKFPGVVSGHRGACTDAETAGYVDSCLSATATTSTCRAFGTAHPRCTSCTTGSTGAEPLWRPKNSDWAWTNDGLCVAIRGHFDCGRAIFAADSCATSACAACAEPIEACVTAAYGLSCADLQAAKDACVSKLPVEVSECLSPSEGSITFDALAKQRITQACGS